jgi:DNA-binding CsgD family transcriptional regulator
MLVSVTLDAPPALPDSEAVRARHGLTKREAEVALLLAEGLSNAEIAERLFVSPHTARHHVENVLSKLGINSRAAVAARLLGTA